MAKLPTCLYLVSFDGGIKIGVARDPHKRLAGLNREGLGRHKLVAVWPHSDPVEIEDMTRDAMEQFRLRGRERFSLPVPTAKGIIDAVVAQYAKGGRAVPAWKRDQLRTSARLKAKREQRDLELFGLSRTETHPRQRITPEIEAEMEALIADGEPISLIAKRYKVAVATVRLRFNKDRIAQIRARAERAQRKRTK